MNQSLLSFFLLYFSLPQPKMWGWYIYSYKKNGGQKTEIKNKKEKKKVNQRMLGQAGRKALPHQGVARSIAYTARKRFPSNLKSPLGLERDDSQGNSFPLFCLLRSFPFPICFTLFTSNYYFHTSHFYNNLISHNKLFSLW